MSTFEDIRAVVFDLDGTLRHSRPAFSDTLFDIAERLGVDGGPAARRKGMRWLHYYWAQSPELLEDMDAFPEQPDFWTEHARHALLAMDCDPARAAGLAPEVYRQMETFKPEDWVPGDVAPALQALQDGGYRLAVLSNRTRPYTEQLNTLGLLPFFEFALAAGEVESWKPEPGVFEHAMRMLKLPASQIMYVGDNYYADVLGSRGVGIRPVLLDPDDTFPDADCAVIRSLGDLPALLATA